MTIKLPAEIEGHEAICACGTEYLAQSAQDPCPDCNGMPHTIGPRITVRVDVDAELSFGAGSGTA